MVNAGWLDTAAAVLVASCWPAVRVGNDGRSRIMQDMIWWRVWYPITTRYQWAVVHRWGQKKSTSYLCCVFLEGRKRDTVGLWRIFIWLCTKNDGSWCLWLMTYMAHDVYSWLVMTLPSINLDSQMSVSINCVPPTWMVFPCVPPWLCKCPNVSFIGKSPITLYEQTHRFRHVGLLAGLVFSGHGLLTTVTLCSKRYGKTMVLNQGNMIPTMAINHGPQPTPNQMGMGITRYLRGDYSKVCSIGWCQGTR